MGLPCRVRVNYRGYAVAVHRRLCYPHVTSAAVVYGGRGYWTNGQRICLTRPRETLRLLQCGRHARRWGLCSSRVLFVNSRVRFVRVVRVSPVCISVLVAITVHLLP